MLEGRMHIVSYCEFLTLDVSSASYLCDVHNAVCNDRGQRWLSDQREHVPNGREERETAREGTREPVNKTARDRDPRTCEQRRAVPTAGEVYKATRGSTTRGEERNTVLQVSKPTTIGQQV